MCVCVCADFYPILKNIPDHRANYLSRDFGINDACLVVVYFGIMSIGFNRKTLANLLYVIWKTDLSKFVFVENDWQFLQHIDNFFDKL